VGVYSNRFSSVSIVSVSIVLDGLAGLWYIGFTNGTAACAGRLSPKLVETPYSLRRLGLSVYKRLIVEKLPESGSFSTFSYKQLTSLLF
jgi:hypothetical protein